LVRGCTDVTKSAQMPGKTSITPRTTDLTKVEILLVGASGLSCMVTSVGVFKRFFEQGTRLSDQAFGRGPEIG